MPTPIHPIVRNANLAIAGVFLTLALIVITLSLPFDLISHVLMKISIGIFAIGRKILDENSMEPPTEEDPTCEH